MKNFQLSQFSNFFLIGINHKSADIAIREKFNLDREQASHLIYSYKKSEGDGIMILPTCNRTEIYAFANCPRDIISLFCKYTNISYELFYQYQNVKKNRQAVEHLFRVGCGLESKILGDFEIIGQIKKSFQFAEEQQAHNVFLERLVNTAIQTSKRVKNETQLSNGAASIAFAAVSQVKKYILGNPQPKILVLGTGKIGRTTCENLINQTGIQNITLVNRTEEKAGHLAKRFGVKHLDYSYLKSGLDEADVIIVATGASHPIVKVDHFKTLKYRLLLDLSMPRNIAGELYTCLGFEVYDVDRLSSIAEEGMRKRRKEIPAAMAIISEALDEFYLWLESRRIAPILREVRQKMDDWKNIEVQNLHKKFPSLNIDLVETLTNQLLNRITGQFARKLKSDENSNLRIIRHIFDLEN